MTTESAHVTPIALAKPTASYVSVDPEIAERWLAGNTVNRRIRPGKVRQYARDMSAGRWQLSSDAIAFGPDGKLLNGQHRLRAVIESSTTIVFLVIRNMPPESMTTMDTGISRSAADALQFAGEHNTALLAATTKQCLLYSDGRMFRDSTVQLVSHGEILSFLDEHPTVRTSVAEIRTVYRSVDAPPSTLATAHWIISQVNDVTYVTYYFDQIATRANEPEGSAVLAVDSRLREIRRIRQAVASRNYVRLFIKGWNYYARDERVKTLAISQRNGQPFAMPQPVRWSR